MASLSANRFLARISHLFLAYDSLLFLNVIEEEALAVRDILQTYENASGQKKINLDKSALVVGKNKSQEQGWTDRLLAQARKEILIKVVIQAIPP